MEAPDAITLRCKAQADVWREAQGLSDEALADAIRADRIDILIDLTMHMARNRLLVFARKPAPVQVTYLAYCGTTGLKTVDYRLTDRHLDPPGRDGSVYSEESIRLPDTYWCFQPVIPTPDAARVAHGAKGVTFGCLNNFCKVTPAALEAWSVLLRKLPEGRLLLYVPSEAGRDRLRGLFATRGVTADRLTLVGHMAAAAYFQTYRQIDVALDPFPYGGGTTTCDALWMGVPVVSLAGATAVSRSGLSILSNVGLADLVADDADAYVRIAVQLANDPARHNELRQTLRERMRSSPLMDAPRFARSVEAAYRDMWRRWCGKSQPPSLLGGPSTT